MDEILSLNQDFHILAASLDCDQEKLTMLIHKHTQVVDKLTSYVKDRILKTQDMLNDHALNMQYIIFDLESTKREKEQLQKRLEDLEN